MTLMLPLSALSIVAMLTSSASAQSAPSTGELVRGLNEKLGAEENVPVTPDRRVSVGGLPDWGVVVRGREGEVVDVFGGVDYQVGAGGEVQVPGYEPPEGASLELIPMGEYAAMVEAVELDPDFAPIETLPGAVETATDYLANALCSKQGRPTQITLSLVVSASGNILFAETGVEAGSQVMWDFPTDVCPRYGYPVPGEGG